MNCITKQRQSPAWLIFSYVEHLKEFLLFSVVFVVDNVLKSRACGSVVGCLWLLLLPCGNDCAWTNYKYISKIKISLINTCLIQNLKIKKVCSCSFNLLVFLFFKFRLSGRALR